MVKYAFGFPVVAMVSHIPAKSCMAVNYVNRKSHTHLATLLPLSTSLALR